MSEVNIKSMGRPTMPRYAPSPPMSPFEEETTNEWRDEVDLCVKCGEKTVYKKTDHVDKRAGYIRGVGQLCTSCALVIRKSQRAGTEKFKEKDL